MNKIIRTVALTAIVIVSIAHSARAQMPGVGFSTGVGQAQLGKNRVQPAQPGNSRSIQAARLGHDTIASTRGSRQLQQRTNGVLDLVAWISSIVTTFPVCTPFL